jgi:hypothetical protein
VISRLQHHANVKLDFVLAVLLPMQERSPSMVCWDSEKVAAQGGQLRCPGYCSLVRAEEKAQSDGFLMN